MPAGVSLAVYVHGAKQHAAEPYVPFAEISATSDGAVALRQCLTDSGIDYQKLGNSVKVRAGSVNSAVARCS